MPLLTDQELHAELVANPNVFQGLDTADWTHNGSHIQPSSVDLHIGAIYLPGEEDPNTPGDPAARTQLRLNTGQTAVVVTREHLNIPRNWAVYGFPPSHVSAAGLLMTNPGHVDPGFSGKLRFTVINMSAQPISLGQGEPIVTLIIHRLDKPVAHDFADRRAAAGLGALPAPTGADVNRLAKDFVDVEARCTAIAAAKIQAAEDKLNRLDSRTKFATAIIGAAALVLGTLGTLLVGYLAGMQAIRSDVNDLKSKIDVVEMKKSIDDLKAKTDDIVKQISDKEKRLSDKKK